MAGLLMESGISGDRIQLEETGSDTLSSVRATVRLLRNAPLQGPVMVATSPYHVPRCLILLCLFGMAAEPCPPLRPHAATPWRRRWYWRVREIAAVPYDAALAVWLRLLGRP
jgi:uncharacterized SAM-binding protein YcdF (DUF218 family)